MKLKRGSRHERRGWLFDVYPSSEGMVLWVITEEGQRLKLIDSFHPSFYFDGPSNELRKVFLLLSREATSITAKQVERIEFFSGESIPVVQVTLQNPTRFSSVVKEVTHISGQLNLYNCDISLPQLYFYERNVFPLAFCAIAYTEAGRVLSIQALDSAWDLDYSLPPLRFLALKLEGELINPNHGWRGKLEIHDERECHVLEGEDPMELITLLNNHLHRQDPDLIFTDWGDSFILPQLRKIAQKGNIPLAFNRDSRMEIAGRKSRSYASYGRIVYTAGAQTLFGRWHIDRQNSFILNEAGLDGLFEQARVTKLPVQHMARTSTGTGITSMQLEIAYREGILIPWRKREPEEFKSAYELLTIDKGGLVFLPPVGFYEDIAELDFASMYPAIMARFNISPETVGCACCPGNRVPETGYAVCTQRRGLVPKTLEPLLSKRACYKKRLKSITDPAQRDCYDRRQTALKWLLVVSFGYLGYKNARFGRIEAHECVTAYSREKLLQAKEIAEGQGYQLIHAIVDSVWVKKAGATEQDYQRLAHVISQGTGLFISLEGIYRWIGFLPSKTKPTLSVPNRFLGVFHSGTVKIRGLEVRRSDTPPFVKAAQARMIEVLSQAQNIKDYEARIPQVITILAEYRQRLREGLVSLKDLAITRSLSQDPRNYEKATLSAVVAQELLARGIKLDPGESIQYIITNAADKDPASRARAYATMAADSSYDTEKYTELLLKSGESLLSLFGYDLKTLDTQTRA
ncbi:MAG: DNA polymerase domain-containing protein [Nitrospiria bacterium]